MATLCSAAFARTSDADRFKKPATLPIGMPRRSVSLRKNKSALSHSTSGYSLRNPEADIINPHHAPPPKMSPSAQELILTYKRNMW